VRMGAKAVAKGILYVIVNAVVFAVGPYLIIHFIPQYISGVTINTAILPWIEVVGGAIALVAFFVGFLKSKTIGHGVAGLVQAGFIATYIYYVIGGGYAGTFGVFTVSFQSANITLTIGDILLISILIVGISSLIYLAEIVQAIRMRRKVVPVPAPAAVQTV